MRDLRQRSRDAIVFSAVVVALGGGCSSSGGRPSGTNGDAGSNGGSGDVGAGGASAAGGASGNSGSSGSSGSGGTGGGSGAGGSSGAGATSTDTLWEGFASALCQHYLNCPGEPYHGDILAALTDEAGCTAALKKHLLANTHYAALNKGVADGILTVNASVTSACFAATKACTYPLDTLPTGELSYEDITPCREMFEGKVPLGGDCNATEECTGEAVCLAAANGACIGKCTARLAAGATCAIGRQCGGPSTTSWSVCHDKQCDVVTVAAPTNGQCGFASETQFAPCASGLYCPNPVLGNLSCSGLKDNGATCDANATPSECKSGLCSGGTCQAWTVSKTGGPCGGSATCDDLAGLACNTDTHLCVKAGGGVCDIFAWYGVDQCDKVPPKAVGATCSVGADCASGICDTTRGCLAALCSK
jgi:hypothetical protein